MVYGQFFHDTLFTLISQREPNNLISLISQGVDGIALCGFEGLNANGEQGC